MASKSARQDLIKTIISSGKISSHEDLLTALMQKDLVVTQATLSRDLNEMGVVKVKDSLKGYYYKFPDEVAPSITLRNGALTIDGIRSIEFGEGKAVIKTYPGFAGAVATVLDDNVKDEIMGTIAGDDTVLVMLRDGYAKKKVLKAIAVYIPGIEKKLITR